MITAERYASVHMEMRAHQGEHVATAEEVVGGQDVHATEEGEPVLAVPMSGQQFRLAIEAEHSSFLEAEEHRAVEQ